MNVSLRPVTTRADLTQYIDLPAQLYRDYPNWVPPLYADEWAFHTPGKNPALSQSEVIRLLAFSGHKVVGRIMGIIHHDYNRLKNEKTARFFHFDLINDPLVAQSLIGQIAAWAQSHQMNKLIGPYGFSDKDPQGLQIKGFEHLPVIGTPSHPPYLNQLLEGLGFQKEIDCVSYSFAIPISLPSLYQRIAARAGSSKQIKLIEFTKKKEMRPYILPVLRLVNETYEPLFGFMAMSEAEMKKLADQYMPILDPELIKVIIDQQNTVLAFVVAMPEMSAGIKRAKGKLFPFGFLHILKAAKNTKQLNLMLGAVKTGFRGIGLNVLLAQALFQTGIRRGFTTIDSHLILETNQLMRAECERLGGEVYKQYRVYSKSLV